MTAWHAPPEGVEAAGADPVAWPSLMAGSGDDDPVPLSALQHYLFCPRQCALIHVERAVGRERAHRRGHGSCTSASHAPKGERRQACGVVHGHAAALAALGVAGVADVVEFTHRERAACPFRSSTSAAGRRRTGPTRCSSARRRSAWRRCWACRCPTGALFYGETRRRAGRRLRRRAARADRGGRGRGARRCSPPAARRRRLRGQALRRLLAAGALPAARRWSSRAGSRPGSRRARSRTDGMRRYLNTLYVTTEGAWLRKDGANLVVEVEAPRAAACPAHMLGGLVCFGPGRRLAAAARLLLRERRHRHLPLRARPVPGARRRPGLRQRAAAPRAVPPQRRSRRLSRHRAQLRPRQGAEPARRAAPRAARPRRRDGRGSQRRRSRPPSGGSPTSPARAQKDQGTDALRGLEGEAADVYFAVFDHLIRERRAELPLPRPLAPAAARPGQRAALVPLHAADPRLPLGAARRVGLDPAVGFLHRDRPGRPSLALDLMEEFRPVLADRLALSLINRRQLGPATSARWRTAPCC